MFEEHFIPNLHKRLALVLTDQTLSMCDQGEHGDDGEFGLSGKSGARGKTGVPGLPGDQGAIGPKVTGQNRLDV